MVINTISAFVFDRAPDGCLQYHTGVTNIFTSFNWDGTGTGSTPAATKARFLSTQEYRICFRQEKGIFFILTT